MAYSLRFNRSLIQGQEKKAWKSWIRDPGVSQESLNGNNFSGKLENLVPQIVRINVSALDVCGTTKNLPLIILYQMSVPTQI